MFHRVDGDPLDLDAARYFRLAELLPYYDGAVRGAALREHRAGTATGAEALTDFEAMRSGTPATGDPYAEPVVTPRATAGQPASANDIASLAAMSQHSGFPGIEYNAPVVTHDDALPFVPDNVREDFD